MVDAPALVTKRGRGRPPLPVDERKVRIGMRLSPDVLDALRATGKDWMPRADDILRRAVLPESP